MFTLADLCHSKQVALSLFSAFVPDVCKDTQVRWCMVIVAMIAMMMKITTKKTLSKVTMSMITTICVHLGRSSVLHGVAASSFVRL